MKTNNEDKILELPIDKVKPNPDQPRKSFDKEKMKEFTESIKVNGQLTPITVTKKNDFWEIVSGERRWRALKDLKIKTIKAIEKEYKDEKTKKIETIIENIQREDLVEEEKYKYFKDIMETENIKTIGELSKKTGVATTSLKNLFDIYEIRQELNENLKKEATSAVILETLRLPDKEERKKVIAYATKKEIGGRPVRELVKKLKNIDKKEVKEALFKEDITIEQAERINKLKSPESITKAIQEHKNIQMVEKGVERNISATMNAKEKRAFDKKLIQAGNVITSFRNSVTDSYSGLELTLKTLTLCIPYISVMDKKQKDTFDNQLERLLEILERGVQLTEQIKEKIK
jgi:ParB family chromosome partitioning protein